MKKMTKKQEYKASWESKEMEDKITEMEVRYEEYIKSLPEYHPKRVMWMADRIFRGGDAR